LSVVSADALASFSTLLLNLDELMISKEQIANIRRLFHAEHWKVGTIASELGLHPETVKRALETDQFKSRARRPLRTDPFLDFIEQTLKQHPRLRATRLFEMLRDRGYQGSVRQVRRLVQNLRPLSKEAFLRLSVLPGEQAQADWASFGEVRIGSARRCLSCFVITLSYSRALYLEFFFDQTLESLLRGHVNALTDWGAVPRTLLVDYVPRNIVDLMCPRGKCGRGSTYHLDGVWITLSWEHNF
jgi:transposase